MQFQIVSLAIFYITWLKKLCKKSKTLFEKKNLKYL